MNLGLMSFVSKGNLDKDSQLEQIIDSLSPKERQIYDEAMALSNRKRRILTLGYIVSLIIVVVGIASAYYFYGLKPYTNHLWYFCVPFFLAGLTMLGFSHSLKTLQ